MNQLSLFEDKALKTAGELLDLLNYGLKEKEQYRPQHHFIHNGYMVFIVANRKKKVLANITDILGEIPNGFSVNWRTLTHIKQEINL